MSINKNIFKQTYQEFKKKLFRNKATSYNKDFDKSEEYKKLYDDDERRTKLYNYMREELKLYDASIDDNSILRRGRTQATIWETGTNEELIRILQANPDLDIIFNTMLYILNTEKERQRLIRQLKANMEENKKQEDEKKRLIDEKEKKITAQQEYEKKEEDDRLENIKRLEEIAKLKKDAKTAKMLETRARNKKIKKIAEEEKTQELIRKQIEEQTKQDNLRFREEQEKKQQETKKPRLQPQLTDAGKKKAADRKVQFQTLLKVKKKTPESEDFEETDKEESFNEESDDEEDFEERRKVLAAMMFGTNKQKPEKQKPQKKSKKLSNRAKELENLTKNIFSNKKIELDRKQGLEELEELVNKEREKVLKEERKRVGVGVDHKTEIEEKGIERKPSETNAEYKKRYVEYINTLPTGVNPSQFKGLERRPGESTSAYTQRYLEYTNKLMRDITPGMSASEQKEQLADNYESIDHTDPGNDELYDIFSNYGISQTLINVLGLIGPASVAVDKAGSIPLYISHNLIRKGYNNIVNFLWRKGKIKNKDIDLYSKRNKNKEIEKSIKKDEEEDKKEESKIEESKIEESKIEESKIERKNDIYTNILGLGEAGLAGVALERVTRPSDPNAVKPVKDVSKRPKETVVMKPEETVVTQIQKRKNPGT